MNRQPHKVSSTHLQIWEAVRCIPKGKVSTYGGIARLSGNVGQARLVGYALHALPSGSDVPWHRVINSQGRVSFRKKGGSHERQRLLLRKEGIVFEGEKVDLSRFGWPGLHRTSGQRK
jgi:methylated-DNA-protein-cysteine methyltransferase-like protein